jgi:hypothetical protein
MGRCMGQSGITDEKTSEERMEICKKCDSFVPMFKLCNECKCFMPLKVTFANMKCPLGKW